jgi:hypothetical protein
MRSAYVFPTAFGALAFIALAAPAQAEIVVNIDKNTQTMTVAVDGAQRYVWPVSTGRPGYDTPNGTFRPNRMDADHLSQEWDNAPMPHAIFFDMNGHAIHGFFDVKHLGSPVSHGCVRLSPDHATTLFNLVGTEGMKATTVVVSGRTPAGRMPEVARRQVAPEDASGQPMQIAPDYPQRAPADYAYGQQPGYAPAPADQGYTPQPGQRGYAQAPVPPAYPPPPQPAAPYDTQAYYRQAQPYGQQGYYRQPVQPPPQQFFLFQSGN